MKHRYLVDLEYAKGRDEASIEAIAAALDRFAAFHRHGTFAAFRLEQARLQGAEARRACETYWCEPSFSGNI